MLNFDGVGDGVETCKKTFSPVAKVSELNVNELEYLVVYRIEVRLSW